MDFYCILQTILSERNLSIPDAARICNIPDSTLRSIIARKNKTVALEVAMKISKGLNVSLERLNGMENEKETKLPQKIAASPAEEKLLNDFRSLDSIGKSYILQTMEMVTAVHKKKKTVKE